MEDERYMFDNLGRNEEIVSLEDPHIPFNPSSERERNENKSIGRVEQINRTRDLFLALQGIEANLTDL
jgi:hypothetical protein